jgi:hypothetical protein
VGLSTDGPHLAQLASRGNGSLQETPADLASVCQAFINIADRPDRRGKDVIAVMALRDTPAHARAHALTPAGGCH